MSYLVLARKWRPQTFDDVVGQKTVVRTLQNAIARNRVAHGMIFSGVRGVGKTTLARLVAKALNCRQGPAITPCNLCDSCTSIAAGTSIDLHEIDGASNRGIQEIRELKENIRFFPNRDRFKIVIIDEVHMLTTEAFNALLKTLEEPPEHVYFLFATTELHRVPITILSRCQRYELKRIPNAELSAFFAKVAAAEGVSLDPGALAAISREAGGSVRDGLSLLDQVFSYSGDTVSLDDVRQVLGLVDRQAVGELAGALLAGDLQRALGLLDEAQNYGMDLKRLMNELLLHFRSLLLCRISDEAEKLIDLPAAEIALLQQTANHHSVETLHNGFQLLVRGAEEMNSSGQPRLAFELALLRTARAGEVVPITGLLERLDGLLSGELACIGSAAGGEQPARPAASHASPHPAANLTTAEPVAEPPATPEPRVEESSPPPSPPASPAAAEQQATGVPAAPGTQQAAREQSTTGQEPHRATPPARQREVRKHWEEFLQYVKERKNWMAHTLRLTSGVREENGKLTLKFDLASDCRLLQSRENVRALTEYAQDFFQKELSIVFRVLEEGGEVDGAENSAGPQEERRALTGDPLVQMATDVLDGRIAGVRTGPRFR